MQWHIAPLSSPSPEGLFILILSDVSKLLMDFGDAANLLI